MNTEQISSECKRMERNLSQSSVPKSLAVNMGVSSSRLMEVDREYKGFKRLRSEWADLRIIESEPPARGSVLIQRSDRTTFLLPPEIKGVNDFSEKDQVIRNLFISLLIGRLIERKLRKHVDETGQTLTGWDNKPTTSPTALMITSKFKNTTVIRIGSQRIRVKSNTVHLKSISLYSLLTLKGEDGRNGSYTR
jgi:hypothetical protein